MSPYDGAFYSFIAVLCIQGYVIPVIVVSRTERVVIFFCFVYCMLLYYCILYVSRMYHYYVYDCPVSHTASDNFFSFLIFSFICDIGVDIKILTLKFFFRRWGSIVVGDFIRGFKVGFFLCCCDCSNIKRRLILFRFGS